MSALLSRSGPCVPATRANRIEEKRALSTFGNPFGLALYDREQQNVRGRRKNQRKSSPNGPDRPITWLVLSSEGEYISTHEDPVDYCKAMRQMLEAISTRERLRDFWQRNLVTIAMLRSNLPDLKTQKGEHYADILITLYKHQMRLIWEEQKAYERRAQELAQNRQAKDGRQAEKLGGENFRRLPSNSSEKRESQDATIAVGSNGLHGPGESRPNQRGNGGGTGPSQVSSAAIKSVQLAANGQKSVAKGNKSGRVDKSILPISTPRRIRDREHLRYVATQPCIICGRSPAQAHHLRFAQPSALGSKVSDEWTIPICASHHRALHGVGNEENWWTEKGINPVAHAVRLWWDTKHGGNVHQKKVDGPKK